MERVFDALPTDGAQWNQKSQSHITIIQYLVKRRPALAVLRLLHRDLDPLHVRRVPHRRIEPVAVRVPEGEDRLHRRLALFWFCWAFGGVKVEVLMVGSLGLDLVSSGPVNTRK